MVLQVVVRRSFEEAPAREFLVLRVAVQKSLEEGDSLIGTSPVVPRTVCSQVHLCRASTRALPAIWDW